MSLSVGDYIEKQKKSNRTEGSTVDEDRSVGLAGLVWWRLFDK